MVKRVNDVKKHYGAMPVDNDMDGAVDALERLRTWYEFNITQFAEGDILGQPTSAKMSAEDMLHIGQALFL